MRLLRIFCSVVEDDLLLSSGTRAFQEQPLDDDRQTGKGMARVRSGESTYPSILHLTYLSTPSSCTSPPGAQALDRVTRLGTERPTRGVRLHSAERETKLF